jgi:hypothetical protein
MRKKKLEYVQRLRMILNTELRAENKMDATGTLATPALRQHQEETEELDRKNKGNANHPWTATPTSSQRSFYVPSKETGRGGVT